MSMIALNDFKIKKDLFTKLAKEYNLSLVLLYGSVVNGTTTSLSDVDIAIRGVKTLDFNILLKIEEEIKKILEISNVQVIDINNVSENFLAEILPGSFTLFVKNEVAFDSFKIYIWKISAESKWLRDMNYAYLKKSILNKTA